MTKNNNTGFDEFYEALNKLDNKKYIEKIEALQKKNKKLKEKILRHLEEVL